MATDEKQVQGTNNGDESIYDTEGETDVQGTNVLNENKGGWQLEDDRDDDAVEEEQMDYDQVEEEEDNEAEETDSENTYARRVIPFDVNMYAGRFTPLDKKITPHATSSPKGNTVIMI